MRRAEGAALGLTSSADKKYREKNNETYILIKKHNLNNN
jgi:hypothetical protein